LSLASFMADLIPGELARSVAQRRAVLFAGAGLSMSVGLPSWERLIHHMGRELGLESEALRTRAATYHALAEYYESNRAASVPLRSWMDRNWKVSEDRVRASKIHELIVRLDFPIIYTTHYDRNIEAAFEARGRNYVKVANARNMAKIREGVTQIVKFHGDFDDDESLVITETDYFNRLAFDSPLDVKFRSGGMGNTLLFVGYSMNDMNIRLLLHNLWRTWKASGYERDRPKSFVFMTPRDACRRPSWRSGASLSWGAKRMIRRTR